MEERLFEASAGLARLAALPDVEAIGFFGWVRCLSSRWRSCLTCSGDRPLRLVSKHVIESLAREKSTGLSPEETFELYHYLRALDAVGQGSRRRHLTR